MTRPDKWSQALSLIRKYGASLSPGLSDRELDIAEKRCGTKFPPDLRSFLSAAMPVGKGFPDWRDGDDAWLKYRLDWPLDGICFDIEHAAFWRADWGDRPEELKAAFEVARQIVAAAPRLIPIYSHRFIPAEPLQPGNPVFSVYQTDIIYYGRDLPSYFDHEFGNAEYMESIKPEPRDIRFWSDLTS